MNRTVRCEPEIWAKSNRIEPLLYHAEFYIYSDGSHTQTHTHAHTRQYWIFEEIHQELSPLRCKLDGKQINLRSIRIIEVLQKDHRDQNRHQIEWKPNIERIVEVNFRLRQPCKIDISISGVLGLAPCHSRKLQKAGTSRWSAVISACTVAASLDHRTQHMDGPPALLKGEKKEKEKRRSFTSI